MELYTIGLKLYYVPAKNHNIKLVVRNSEGVFGGLKFSLPT